MRRAGIALGCPPRSARSSRGIAHKARPPSPPASFHLRRCQPRPCIHIAPPRRPLPEPRPRQRRLYQRFPLRLHLNYRGSSSPLPSATVLNPYPSSAHHPPHPRPRHLHPHLPRAGAGGAFWDWGRTPANANDSASATPNGQHRARQSCSPSTRAAATPTTLNTTISPGSPPSAYSGGGATARPHTRYERYFSFSRSTPPPSSSGHSSDHGHGQTLQLMRSPSRMGRGSVAAQLSGGNKGIAAALASSTTSTSRKSESGGGGAKKSMLDKAVRYVLDGEAAPDRSAQEI
ncbi:hypothetical protein C8R44DRAFT_992153 [Mycena epipterygia]|nr:hypothetical protein C8R44DRAFT_992153 [Mycena epipterygia]